MTKDLSQFITDFMQKENLSLRAVAYSAKVSPATLSNIINGKTTPSIKICNTLADYFHVPRTKILHFAGWLETDQKEQFLMQIQDLTNQYPEFAEFVSWFISLEDKEDRERALRLLKAIREEKVK